MSPAAAAAAAGSFDDNRVADLTGCLDDFLRVFGECSVRAGHARDARVAHGLLSAHLVAHQTDALGARPNEGEARAFHLFGKIGIFRKEAVARVNRFSIRYFRS